MLPTSLSLYHNLYEIIQTATTISLHPQKRKIRKKKVPFLPYFSFLLRLCTPGTRLSQKRNFLGESGTQGRGFGTQGTISFAEASCKKDVINGLDNYELTKRAISSFLNTYPGLIPRVNYIGTVFIRYKAATVQERL